MNPFVRLCRSISDFITRAFWLRLGLKAKMTLLSVVGMIALITIFGVLAIAAARETTDRALQERIILAQVAANHADYVVNHIRAALEAIAAQPIIRQGDAPRAERENKLREAVAQLGFPVRQVYLADATGQIVAASPPQVNPGSLASVQSALENTPFVITSANLPAHGSVIIAAAPIYDPTGRVTGVIAANLDLIESGMYMLTPTATLGQTGYVEIVDSNGLIVLSTLPHRLLSRADHGDSLVSMIRDGKSVVTTCHNCHEGAPPADRQNEVIAFAPLRNAPWGVVVRQAEEEAFGSSRQLQGRVVLFGIIAVMGAIVLVWLTTRNVIAPVQNLRLAAEQMVRGNWETPIAVRRGDEIGALADTFETMRAQLHKNIAEIQDLNRDLDRRVQARTRELLDAQTALRGSNDYLQSIIDGLDDALLVIGPDRVVQQANQAARKNAAGDELVGLHCAQASHPMQACQPPNCDCPLAAVLATGQATRTTHIHPRRDDGVEYVEIVASPLRDANGAVQAVIELMRDVTEERELRETLMRRNRELSALNAVASVVTQPLHLDEFLSKMLDEVLRVAAADAGAIYLLSQDTRALEPQCCLGTTDDAARAITRLHVDDSACGGVIEKGQPVVIADLARYTAGAGRSLLQEGLRSLVHVPLISRGLTLGTMCIGTRTPHEFSPRQVELLMALGNQIAVGVENARLYDELARREQLRGDLLEKVITAQEEERKRIARDLHDDTSQSLSALIYALEAAETTCADGRVQQTLAHMRGVLSQTLDGVHKLIHDLRPSMLDHLGLFVALRWYAETRLQPASMRLRVDESGALQRLPPQMETALFRVGQEAINNIARHSGARNVRMKFDNQNGALKIDITDDGIGFDLSEVEHSPDRQRGLGLAGMQERVGLLGGHITVLSTPGLGTQVSICVPMEHG